MDWGEEDDPLRFLKAMGAGNPGALPLPDLMSAPEVQRLCAERSKAIFASQARLRGILDRHEPTIQKRWMKKTKQQRLTVLRGAWDKMSATHRPDFAAFRKETEAQRTAGTKYKDAFYSPYINEEELLRPKSLLLMLKSRARCNPCDFAAADGEWMYLGRVTKAIVPIFLNCYVIALNGMTDQKEYGKLWAWEDHPDAFEWVQERRQFLPGEGLDILQVQKRVMEFLVDCSEQLIHDTPATELLSDKYPTQPEPELKAGVEPEGFASLAVMAEEAPYRRPESLDFGRIESLLAACASASEDDIWALREDPGYFSDQMLIYREHRQEMITDTRGQPHPVFKGHMSVFWERVIGNTLVSSHVRLEVFSELRRQAEELKHLQAKYEGKLSPLKDLPEDCLLGILRFRHFINQLAKEWLNDLKTSVVASLPMRSWFVRQPAKDLKMIVIQAKPGLRKNKVEEELLWLLQTLWEDGHTLFLARLPDIVDELERLIRTEPGARQLVSGYIAGRIGDLSILCECLRQVNIFQPWANGYESALVDREKDIKKDFDAWSETWSGILKMFKSRPVCDSFTLAEPTDKRFFYPVEKRRTKETVDALRQAEANLDAFWGKIDNFLNTKAGDLSKSATRKLLSQDRTLQRTPEWVAPAVPDKTKASKSAPVSIDNDSIYRPLSTLYFELENPTTSTSAPTTSHSKNKVKTRGTASQNPAPSVEARLNTLTLNPDNPLDAQPTFAVDARALKVFRALFFSPAVTSTPGEVSWTDFLHAITTGVGFRAEKLYGSVWHFQPPSTLDVERSIQFHEPHSVGKIPFRTARRMGRRLARSYGWWAGMFFLREK